jgi:hypothetical protein
MLATEKGSRYGRTGPAEYVCAIVTHTPYRGEIKATAYGRGHLHRLYWVVY